MSSIQAINDLLVNSFNKITSLEKYALAQGPFSDLTITEMHAIEAVGLQENTMTEIADKLGITAGSLTTTINRLVKKEYVVRQEVEGDRRCVKLVLTKKGKLAWRVHDNFHRHMVKSMLVGLQEEDNQILVDSLKRLSEFFNEELEKQINSNKKSSEKNKKSSKNSKEK